jgi:hypothetical protein
MYFEEKYEQDINKIGWYFSYGIVILIRMWL